MGTPADSGHATDVPTRSLRLFVGAGLFGVVLIAVGLAVDFVLHALDPDLANEESLFTLKNPGHLLLGFGMVGTALGLSGAASIMMDPDGGTRLLHAGRLSLRVGLAVLVVSLVWIAAGPGFGHGHDDVAGALELTDGTRLSSSAAVGVDRSRLPESEALALATLAWSRSGSVDADGGHVHGESDSAAGDLSPSESTAVAAQLAIATEAASKLTTLEQAEAAGYVQASNVLPGVGAHLIKWSLVDQPFDLAAPSMLLFDEVRAGYGLELVGFSYWAVSGDAPEGFVGDSDVWHQHYGLCFENGWLAREGDPDRAACAGDWINGSDLWMLHAWLVPGLENDDGVFADVNELLCDRFCG